MTCNPTDFLKLSGKRRIDPLKCGDRVGLANAFKRSLSELERGDYETAVLGTATDRETRLERLKRAKCLLVIRAVCQSDGTPIFNEKEHLSALLAIDSGVIGAVHSEIEKHVGFEDGDIERLLGNSAPTDGDD